MALSSSRCASSGCCRRPSSSTSRHSSWRTGCRCQDATHSARGQSGHSAALGGRIPVPLHGDAGGLRHRNDSPWVMAGMGILWCRTASGPGSGASPKRCRESIAGNSPSSLRAPVEDPGSAGPVLVRILRSADVWALCLSVRVRGIGDTGNFFTSMLPYLQTVRSILNWGLQPSGDPLVGGLVSCLVGPALGLAISTAEMRTRSTAIKVHGGAGDAADSQVGTIGSSWCSGQRLCSDLNMGPAWAACDTCGRHGAGTIQRCHKCAFRRGGGAAFAGSCFRRHQV